MSDDNPYKAASAVTDSFGEVRETGSTSIVTFEMSEELAALYAHQLLNTVFRYPLRILLFAATFVFTGAMSLFDLQIETRISMTFTGMVLMLVAMAAFASMVRFVREYTAIRGSLMARNELAGPTRQAIIGEEGITFKAMNGQTTVSWFQLDNVRESKDFVFLLRGSLLLGTLPKRAIREETLDRIRRLVV